MKQTLKNKKITVVGAGSSGIAVSKFCKKMNAEVSLNDSKQLDLWSKEAKSLQELDVKTIGGSHPDSLYTDADLIVLSPGVPRNIKPLQLADNSGVNVVGEVELASWFIKCEVIGITGTNGKSTTTVLTGEILKAAGFKTFVGGNLGDPVSNMLLKDNDFDIAVLELSSFQLETIMQFKPKIAAILNVTDDHLDRYDSFNDYAEAKKNILTNMTNGSVLVAFKDDPIVSTITNEFNGTVKWFSHEYNQLNDAWADDNDVVYVKNNKLNKISSFKANASGLNGRHNRLNLMAAVLMAFEAGAEEKDVELAIKDFKGLEHRVQFVKNISGISFYNDSKGTNVGAVISSLKSFDKPVVLLLGGYDKGSDYSQLKDVIGNNVKHTVLFGQASGVIKTALKGCDLTVSKTLSDAVKTSYNKATSGDVILLSPACSSFDEFKDYKERGRFFTKYVNELIN